MLTPAHGATCDIRTYRPAVSRLRAARVHVANHADRYDWGMNLFRRNRTRSVATIMQSRH